MTNKLELVAVFLGFGSSLGDRFRNLRMAITRLESIEPTLSVVAMSSVYESPHLGLRAGDEEAYPAHLNMVVKICTSLPPEALLAEIRKIEDAGGRERNVDRWGPRTIDIDILLYGSCVINTETLKIPHPEIANRAFVVTPLYEIEPELQLPGGQKLEELRSSPVICSQRLEQAATASELLL